MIDTTNANDARSEAHRRAEGGEIPTKFWLNSMGEFGHDWPDGTETLCESVNLREEVERNGIKWGPPYLVPPEIINRAEERVMYREMVDHREWIIYRLWESLQPLQGSTFRFYGGVDYADGKREPRLEMCTELVLTDEKLEKVRKIAEPYGAQIEEMWTSSEEPGASQYEISFSILGASFAEVAELQLRWLNDTLAFEGDVVEVL